MANEARRGIDRARIVDHLRRSPGLRPSDVARRFGVHPSTAEYHLRRLARQGTVVRVRAGRELHHYPAGEGWCQRSRAAHARLTEAGRGLLKLGLDRGVFPRQAIVNRGHSASAVRWAIDRFQEVGILERMAWGVYEVPEDVHACVRAALSEVPCEGCNEVEERGQERRRATSSPSPRGRIEASRSR